MKGIKQKNGSNEWDSLTSPVFRVVNEQGENMAGGLIRKRADNSTYLYVDEVDGYQLLTINERNRLILEPY